MVERVVQAHLSISWVMADCAYGSNARLQASGYCLVLAVRCTEPIEIQTPIGRVRMTVAEDRAHLASGLAVPLDGRRKQGASLVRLGVFADLAPLRRRWVPLPARPAHGDGAEQKAFYLVLGPIGTTLADMVQAMRRVLVNRRGCAKPVKTV